MYSRCTVLLPDEPRLQRRNVGSLHKRFASRIKYCPRQRDQYEREFHAYGDFGMGNF